MAEKLKVYEYKACSTCKKATRWLEQQGIQFTAMPIVDTPPTKKELKTMLKYLEEQGGSLKNLFNTSGQVYRELKISDKLKKGMSQEEALDLLAQNGKLIKRPFVLGKNTGSVGFKEDVWSELFLN